MAARRNIRRREAQLAFEALTIEGGLLSPEWLSRVAQLSAGHQSEADYRVPKGLNLRDELGRYWRMAQAHWHDFVSARTSNADARATAERFITALLRDTFGFGTLAPVALVVISERRYPIGHAALGQKVPVVIAPAGFGLDTLALDFGDGTRRRSAFGLAQEFLNAADGSMWGLASDGLSLRVLRDNASLTRPAWLEVDLQRIFTEERYPDFAALWLLLHETRFGRADQPASECALEAWRTSGREEGTKAREKLRFGVEDALLALGQGFIEHRDNQSLRDALRSGALTKQEYFQQLLRVVYRIIFLLTAEERGLLHAPDATDAAKALYAEGYAVRRLRERAVRRNAFDHFFDLWEGLTIVVRGLEKGEPLLGLPALAGIFSAPQCRWLDGAKLENHRLLTAIFKLSWIREDSGLSRVNWRDMGPEELGSVYESLLELVPQVADSGREFQFASADESKGNARKTSGSYYTPDSLVQVLLDSALEPVVQRTIAANPQKSVDALLQLAIVDPACGSGHFLLAAARRLAAHVARLEANGTPSAMEYRHALRQVVGRCIFGVDLNPMAVELCKVALWMEAVEPGRPLSFLDSHIQQGNALLGTTPELMVEGIPDDAWTPIEGDVRKTASALKKRNKSERKQLSLALATVQAEVAELTSAASALDVASDADAAALAKKTTHWEALRESAAFRHQKLVADAWCAAFVWPKEELPNALAEVAPTNEVWRQLRDEPLRVARLTVEEVERLTRQYDFFHWHLGFPQVFAKGGFDVVLGNPPWERVKLQEQEFFASRSEEIATAINSAARKKLLSTLAERDPHLWRQWCDASRMAEGQSHFLRQSGRYPLCGKGDVNTYALFAEHNWTLAGTRGRAGFIVPTGIATDEGTSFFMRTLVTARGLQQIVSFENEGTTFGSVNNRQSFCLMTLTKTPVERSRLLFNVNQPLPENPGPLDFELAPEDFGLFNPNTGNCPTFRTRRDAAINLSMYRRAGVLWREGGGGSGNPWGIRFMAMIHMANDSGLFKSRAVLESGGHVLVGNTFTSKSGNYLPLVEAKMLNAYDHRFGTYEGATEAHFNKGFLPRFTDKDHANAEKLSLPDQWIASNEVNKALENRWSRGWFLGWRDICRRTDVRTVLPSLLPRAAVGHKFPLVLSEQRPTLLASFYADLCSYALDYAARQKVGGTSLTYFILKQLPVFPPIAYEERAVWSKATTVEAWILPRVLELTYTAWDLESFAHDVGYDGPPFRWDPERRFLLRCELDAAFFHLYGISRDDAAYVLDTFPIVKRNDEKDHGEYRTQRVILEIHDAMTDAVRTDKPYQTRLDPPPADPRVAHPDTRKAQVKGKTQSLA